MVCYIIINNLLSNINNFIGDRDLPASLPQGEVERNVFLIAYFDVDGPIQKGRRSPKKINFGNMGLPTKHLTIAERKIAAKPANICAITNTVAKREKYCKEKFKASRSAIEKCIVIITITSLKFSLTYLLTIIIERILSNLL